MGEPREMHPKSYVTTITTSKYRISLIRDLKSNLKQNTCQNSTIFRSVDFHVLIRRRHSSFYLKADSFVEIEYVVVNVLQSVTVTIS